MWKHSVELFFGYSEAFTVGAVHNQNDNLKDPQHIEKPAVRAHVITVRKEQQLKTGSKLWVNMHKTMNF